MKNINRTIAVLVNLVFIYGLFPGWAFAQNFTEPGSINGFNRSVFDYHFSRADREINPNRWLAEARRGIGLAINAWEIISLDMFDTVFEKDNHRMQLEKWSENELEYRFSQWLTKRFFGEEYDNLLKILSDNTSEIHRRYTYHLDEYGNVLYDKETGKPLIVRISDDGREYSSDLAHWRMETQQNITAISVMFESFVLSQFPQLLAYIPVEDREIFEIALNRSVLYASSALKTEFENIVAREERLFEGRRTGNNNSNKFRSDSDESRYITAYLINEAKSVCDTGIAALQTRIEEASNGEGDLVLMGTEWLEMYRDQFDRGLKIWEEAEERFFIRRIEWEQESLRLFQTGEEAWIIAFSQLEEERQKWELQVKSLFDSGEALFRQASANLEFAISEARIEFENNLRLRTESGSAKANALIDMYFTCVNAARSAKENVLYWINMYDNGNIVDITSVNMNTWIDNEKLKVWKGLEESYISSIDYKKDLKNLLDLEKKAAQPGILGSIYKAQYEYELGVFNIKHSLLLRIQNAGSGKLSENEKEELLKEIKAMQLYNLSAFNYFDEILTSYNLYLTFYHKSLEMRENLIYGFDGIFGSGTLKEILDNNYSSDDFVLDEYQIALIKAKILVKYWEQRTEIAKSVNFYAGELEAGRITYTESNLQWENAMKAYESSVITYEEEMKKLNGIGTEMQNMNAALSGFLLKMNEAVACLDNLNNEYKNMLFIHSLDDKFSLNNDLVKKYSEILTEYIYLNSTDFYLNEQVIAHKIENMQKDNDVVLILEYLVNGSEDMISLSELEVNVLKILIIDDGKTILGSSVEYGINDKDASGVLINNIIEEYKDKYLSVINNAYNEGDVEILNGYYNTIIRDICYSAKKEAESILAIRKMQIKFFSDNEGSSERISAYSYGSAEWYSEAWNLSLSENEKEQITGYNLGDYLLNDYLEKYDVLTKKRLKVEMEALEYLLDRNNPADNKIKLLADYCLIDKESIYESLMVLGILFERMNENSDYTIGNDDNDIVIGWFLSGGSFFSISGIFFTDEYNDYIYAEGLYNSFMEFSNDCRFIEREEMEKLSQRLNELFSKYNIITEEPYMFLPDIDFVANILVDSGEDFIKKASLLFIEIDKLLFFIPSWMKDEIDEWKNSLINHAIMLSIVEQNNNILPGESSIYFEGYIDKIDIEIENLIKYLYSINEFDLKKIIKINEINNELIENKILCLYQYVFTLMYEDTVNYLNRNDNNWRMFIGNQYIENSEISVTSNYLIGFLYDAIEWSAIIDSRVNNAFAIYGNEVNIDSNENQNYLILSYLYETEKNIIHLYNYEMMKNEIISIGLNIDYLLNDYDDKIEQLHSKLQEIKIAENIYADINLNYLNFSMEITEKGKLYNLQYIELINAFNVMEKMKHEYEIQDAVRRWSSTAYLDFSTDDVYYSENKLIKARTAEKFLSNLYDEYTEQRMYDNNNYNNKYIEYEEAYLNMLIGAKAAGLLNSDLSKEIEISNYLFRQIINQLNIFGGIFEYSSEYVYPENRYNLTISDIITLNNGKIAFSMDSNFIINGYDQENTEKLINYFTLSGNNLVNEKTEFQQEIERLISRMEVYFNNPEKMDQWGLARDYLIRSIAGANQDIQYLKEMSVRAEMIMPGTSLGNMYYQESLLTGKNRIGNYMDSNQFYYRYLQEQAWNNLSSDEKNDLEFYIILTLNNNNGYNYGFSQFTVLNELQRAYNKVRDHYNSANKKSKKLLTGWAFNEMRDLNKTTMRRINTVRTETLSIVSTWKTEIINNISEILYLNLEYSNSKERINNLLGGINDNNIVVWNDIETALLDKLEIEEMLILENKWMEMIKENNDQFSNIAEGVYRLAEWLKERKEKSKILLDEQWENDNYERLIREQEYFFILDAYMNGDADDETLTAAIEEAYGGHTASWKKHYQNKEKTILKYLSQYNQWEHDLPDEFASLARDYVEIIKNSIGKGLIAEFEAREAEWEIKRLDIIEKTNAWLESAVLILERGRNDWENNATKMMNSYKKWDENFREEYERISYSWNEAYLSGLEDKAQWLERAANAANNAMSSAMLSTIGSEAERFSRIMDTREFNGLMSYDIAADAGNVLAQILKSPGITGMSGAFGSINNMVNFGDVYIRQGFSISGIWDAGNARLEAAIISQETNKAIAERESRVLAANARIAADRALEMLAENVDAVNKNIRDKMDNTYIIYGQWNRNGNIYVKDIITGSTLFTPVITDRKKVQGYNDFRIGPVNLKTRLDDAYLDGLEYFAIQILIRNVYDEINLIANEIFGDGERQLVDRLFDSSSARYLDSGKIGEHIGYMPLVNPNGGESKKNMFYDRGRGEIGRLMTEFIYWAHIDAKGVNETGIAPWDKRMWDDTNSTFSSPSLRSITDTAIKIGVAVASVAGIAFTGGTSIVGGIALMVAINSADDLLFNSLDVIYNYKSIDEAGVTFGKAVLSNTVNAAGSAVFGGVGIEEGFFSGGLQNLALNNAAGIVSQTMIKTSMAAAQTFTVGLANNAISGITYSGGNGFGYSTDVFYDGMRGTLVNTVSTASSSLVTGAFTIFNSGHNMEKLGLHSIVNKNNVQKLNNMAGALAGQGVNYLLGDEFTLNLLNTSLFEYFGLKNGGGNSGLLEFRIGNDGSVNMAFGAGGADVSLDTVLAVVKGAAVWGFDIISDIFMSQQDFNLKGSFQANFSFGDNNQRKQIWNILFGKTILDVNDGGEYDAVTKRDDGKRIVTLNGYYDGMSLEDQARLAVILGFEAYRDGYKTGGIDQYGNFVTGYNSYNELTYAVIAHLDMAYRINEDYKWFYQLNQDMWADSIMLQFARETGQMDFFNDYINNLYINEEDYRWRYVITHGVYQTDNTYAKYPLLAERNRIIANSVNRILQQMADESGYEGDLAGFMTENGITQAEIRNKIENDAAFRQQYGVTLDPYYTLGGWGCMLFSLMYILESISGTREDPIEFNNWLVSNNYHSRYINLSRDIMTRVLNDRLGNVASVSLVFDEEPTVQQIIEWGQSDDIYVGHIRIKGTTHSVVLQSVDYIYDEHGNKTGVNRVYVANPYAKGGYEGQNYYTLDQIERLDVFKVSPNAGHIDLLLRSYQNIFQNYNSPVLNLPVY